MSIIKSVELVCPVTDMGDDIKFIDLKMPTVGDLREAMRKSKGDEMELTLMLTEKCCGLSPKGFESLSVPDLASLIEELEPFLVLSGKVKT